MKLKLLKKSEATPQRQSMNIKQRFLHEAKTCNLSNNNHTTWFGPLIRFESKH